VTFNKSLAFMLTTGDNTKLRDKTSALTEA
jgi:hypothetical protein